MLYGASGHCKVIIDVLESNGLIIGSIIDDAPKSDILGFKVLNSENYCFSVEEKMILSIGNNQVRKKLAEKLNVTFVKAIHSKATVSKYSSIGEGTVVMAGVVVNPEVSIGVHCIINTGAVIEHDCKINDFAHISPNVSLAGGVEVGEGSQVGIGASVLQGVKIGKWAVVGAGAVVIRNVPDFAVVVGNPGRVLKIKSDE